jgi:hypothetical protein
MAINSGDYVNVSFTELHGIQKVYIEDYKVVEAELIVASELYKSGQTNTKAALKVVKELARRKVGILEDINAFGRIMDERDGTAAAARRAASNAS